MTPAPHSSSALDCYTAREARHAAEAATARQAMNRYSNWRLLIFIAAVAATVWAVKLNRPLLVILVLIVGLVLFIAAIIRHNHHTRRHERAVRLRDINREGMQRCEGTWQQRSLQGEGFVDKNHAYSSDLDLFGASSVFQWFNTARTSEGQQAVAQRLKQQTPVTDLPAEQTALQELAGKLDWRQRIEAEGIVLQNTDLHPLYQWAEQPASRRLLSTGVMAVRWLPLLTGLLWLAAWLTGMPLLSLLAVSMLALQTVTAGIVSRSLQARLNEALKWEEKITAGKTLLDQVEAESFAAALNQRNKEALQAADGTRATAIFARLETTLSWLSLRHNPIVHIFFNSLALWDLQWMIAIERWRHQHGAHVRRWLRQFAELEARCSFSVIAFENPDWVFPRLHQDMPLQAKGLGHPLLPANRRVVNDFEIAHAGRVAIITGSNMSGKSTFLRTVGLNLVLAYAGAPVCARVFSCAPMRLFTSMRIADDLSRGVSSFYAELLRIKMIVDAAREGPVLYLVDEIFRGTNSGDRIAGAGEVLKALSRGSSVGVVSTHDLELSKLADSQPGQFANYHFSEFYTDDGIDFSYQIQSGPATTTNARQLIRLVGIDV